MEPVEEKRQAVMATLAANAPTFPDLKSHVFDELVAKSEFPELHFISSILNTVLANPRPQPVVAAGPAADPNAQYAQQQQQSARYHPYARPAREQVQQPQTQQAPVYQQQVQYPVQTQAMYQQPAQAQAYMPYGQPQAFMPQYPVSAAPGVGGGAVDESNLISLFVFHLPPDASDSMLQDLFVPFASTGQLESARVVIDKSTGASKGFGFVNFTDRSDAQSAIDIMNGYQLKNKFLKVSFKK